MSTKFWKIRAVHAAVFALGITVLPCAHALAQDASIPDSAKQAEALKAMEAAVDSARKAAAGVAARARLNEKPADSAQNVGDSDVAAGAAKAAGETAVNTAKVLNALGDTAGKSVADTTDKTVSETKPTDTTARAAATIPDKLVDSTAPYKNVEFASGEKPHVVIETTMGKVVLELWPDVAPKHCQNFVYQITKGFYDSLTVHRVVPGFLIQGGDPEGTGMGGPGYSVPAEFSTKHIHEEGTLSMARRVDPAAKTGAPEKPEYINSAGSQFFICSARFASLDGKYTIFGKVVEGLEVIHKIEKTPAQRERPVAPVYMTKVFMQPKI